MLAVLATSLLTWCVWDNGQLHAVRVCTLLIATFWDVMNTRHDVIETSAFANQNASRRTQHQRVNVICD